MISPTKPADPAPFEGPTCLEVLIIDLSARESECCVCGVRMVGCKQGLPMYEGCVVPVDWSGDWGGMDACPACYARYLLNDLPTWPLSPRGTRPVPGTIEYAEETELVQEAAEALRFYILKTPDSTTEDAR